MRVLLTNIKSLIEGFPFQNSHVHNGPDSVRPTQIYKKSLKTKGFSLAETLIALILMGFFMILLFMSYSNITNSVTRQREKIMVAHAGSQFLNTFASELAQARVLSSDSTSTEIRFSYWDAIRSETMKRGYRISASGIGSFLKLERLNFNETSNTWVASSAFTKELSTSILLNSGTTFQYCTEGSCGVTPDQALFVKLSNWQFLNSQTQGLGDSYILQLPSGPSGDLNFYLASGVTGEMMMSETPRELFRFDKANSLGNSTPLEIASLSTNGREISAPLMTAPNTLTTIVSNRNSPGVSASVIDPVTGAIYFGENDSSGNFYKYLNGTLSTLVSGRPYPGVNNVLLDSARSRVFWGETSASGRLYMYDGSTTQFLTNLVNPGGENALALNPINGNIFIGQDPYFTVGDPGTGSMTILAGGNGLGQKSTVVDPNTGRVYFGQKNNPGDFWTWVSGAASKIATNKKYPGYNSTAIDPTTGRVYFGEWDSAGGLYTWDPGTGLSTIVSGKMMPGQFSTTVSPVDGRVYFGDDTSFYTWSPSSNTLSTIVSGRTYPGYRSTQVDPTTGRVFFGEVASSGNYYTWDPSSNTLSTILTSRSFPGYNASYFDPTSGRAYFGEVSSTGNFYSWSNGTLTTLVSGKESPGIYSTSVDASTGQVYFGASPSGGTGDFFTWSPVKGLSSIITSRTRPGINVSLVDARRGNFFFGEDTTGGNAYLYQSNPSSASTLQRTNHLGIPIKPSPTIAYTSDTLTAGTQDPLGDYYFLNTTSNAIDHYHYDRKTSQYIRTSRLTLAAGLTTPKAITVDQSDASISVLGSSGGAWVIQKYANRNATLTATPSSTVTLTGITSPDVIAPTGLSINGRTGDYLVLDSGLINSNSVRLLVVSNVGVLKKNIAINVTNTNLSTNASSETNFKIGFNDQENILYLIAPTIGSVYGLSLSQLF